MFAWLSRPGGSVPPQTQILLVEALTGLAFKKLGRGVDVGVDAQQDEAVVAAEAGLLFSALLLASSQAPRASPMTRWRWERMEILDINSYLSASYFPNDDLSFERVVNTPKRGIGPSMIKKLAAMRIKGSGLQDAARIMVKDRVLTKKVHENLSEVLDILDTIHDMAPAMAMETVIDRTGYYDYLEKTTKTGGEFISKRENVEQLIYTARSKDTMLEYLEEAALIREDKEEDDQDEKGVALLTIHSAKGLEFDTVFIVGCEERLFPHWRSIDEGDKALFEERRLMYVAMTRAERFLYLSHANYRKGEFSVRSRFIDQIRECLA